MRTHKMTATMSKLALGLALVLVAGAIDAQAASRIFVKFGDNIKGESTDADHVDWCEVDAACDSDQHAAFFPTGDGAFIVLGWHRFRGRTEYAGLLDETAVHDLTLARAEEVLS